MEPVQEKNQKNFFVGIDEAQQVITPGIINETMLQHEARKIPNTTVPEYDNFDTKGEMLFQEYVKYIPYFQEAQSLNDLDMLSCSNKNFINQKKQTVYLRGVNVGGQSKLPYTGAKNSAFNKIDYQSPKHVSFINRPFPLSEAKSHFMRLKLWGLTLVRLLVTWEALEHEGPGIYDLEFIDYLKDLLGIMHSCGLKCIIDPHQDMWSRFSGGSGAPSWTLEAAGFNIRKFLETGAAYIHCESYEKGRNQPKMKWVTNSTKLVTSTMFTLFFGGKLFAPGLIVSGLNIQDYLQQHFIESYKLLAKSLKDSKAVLGFESMNEPDPGYIGLNNLNYYDGNQHLFLGETPTPIQQFGLGSGLEVRVANYVESWPLPSVKMGKISLNKAKDNAWLENRMCVWKSHGVWDIKGGIAILKQPGYFSSGKNTPDKTGVGRIEYFNEYFYKPFLKKYLNSIREINPNWLLFVEPVPNNLPPKLDLKNDGIENLVYSPHWYDLYTLFRKKFSGTYSFNVLELQNSKNIFKHIYFGLSGLVKNYSSQLKLITKRGHERVGVTPTLIGECGVPIDLNGKKAYSDGDYGHQSNMMNAMLTSFEKTLSLNFTLWNYNPYNTNQYGDFWNGEDFSIVSQDIKHNTIDDKIGLKPNSKNIECYNHDINEKNSFSAQPSEASQKTSSEDSSVFKNVLELGLSRTSELSDIHSEYNKAGRILNIIVRPHVTRILGRLVEMNFDPKKKIFKTCFVVDPNTFNLDIVLSSPNNDLEVPAPKLKLSEWLDIPENGIAVIIFVPFIHYRSNKISVKAKGSWLYLPKLQSFYYKPKPSLVGKLDTITISVDASIPKLNQNLIVQSGGDTILDFYA